MPAASPTLVRLKGSGAVGTTGKATLNIATASDKYPTTFRLWELRVRRTSGSGASTFQPVLNADSSDSGTSAAWTTIYAAGSTTSTSSVFNLAVGTNIYQGKPDASGNLYLWFHPNSGTDTFEYEIALEPIETWTRVVEPA